MSTVDSSSQLRRAIKHSAFDKFRNALDRMSPLVNAVSTDPADKNRSLLAIALATKREIISEPIFDSSQISENQMTQMMLIFLGLGFTPLFAAAFGTGVGVLFIPLLVLLGNATISAVKIRIKSGKAEDVTKMISLILTHDLFKANDTDDTLLLFLESKDNEISLENGIPLTHIQPIKKLLESPDAENLDVDRGKGFDPSKERPSYALRGFDRRPAPGSGDIMGTQVVAV